MSTASEASQQANRSGMDPQRLMVIFYLTFAIVFALFLENVLGAIFVRVGVGDGEVISGIGWTVSTVVGVLLSIGTVIGCYMHPVVKQLSTEVATELMKVTWPSWSETRVATGAVVFASLIASFILFGIDSVAYKLMVDWLPTLWGKL